MWRIRSLTRRPSPAGVRWSLTGRLRARRCLGAPGETGGAVLGSAAGLAGPRGSPGRLLGGGAGTGSGCAAGSSGCSLVSGAAGVSGEGGLAGVSQLEEPGESVRPFGAGLPPAGGGGAIGASGSPSSKDASGGSPAELMVSVLPASASAGRRCSSPDGSVGATARSLGDLFSPSLVARPGKSSSTAQFEMNGVGLGEGLAQPRLTCNR